MLNLAHHHLWRRKLQGKGLNSWQKFLDRIVYVVAILAPFVTLPQVIKVFSEKNAAGLSVWSWIGYSLGSVIWLLYGMAHKEKPIVLSNAPVLIMNIIIVIGIILYA